MGVSQATRSRASCGEALQPAAAHQLGQPLAPGPGRSGPVPRTGRVDASCRATKAATWAGGLSPGSRARPGWRKAQRSRAWPSRLGALVLAATNAKSSEVSVQLRWRTKSRSVTLALGRGEQRRPLLVIQQPASRHFTLMSRAGRYRCLPVGRTIGGHAASSAVSFFQLCAGVISWNDRPTAYWINSGSEGRARVHRTNRLIHKDRPASLALASMRAASGEARLHLPV